MSKVLFRDFLVVSDGELFKSSVLVENGIISLIGNISDHDINTDTVIYDGNGKKYLTPGFIDIHIHGGGGFDFMDGIADEFKSIARFHSEHGTTTLIPTILPSTKEDIDNAVSAFRLVNDTPGLFARMPGIHFEGPFISKKQKGALDDRFIHPINETEYRELYNKRNHVIRVTFAPELEKADKLIDYLVSQNIVASVGHTDAVYGDVVNASSHGAKMSTHLYSAMTQTRRIGISRFGGVVETVYLDDSMYTEIIADGIHLPNELILLAYKNKGPDKIALITDAMRGAGQVSGDSILGSRKYGSPVIIEDDVAKLPDRSAFAGSIATTDRLMRTAFDAGIPFKDVITMLTKTPAEIMSLNDIGVLVPGYKADLNIISEDKRKVISTFIDGNIIR